MANKTKLKSDEVSDVIKKYKEQHQTIGKINYMEIHRFAVKLFDDGKVSALTSDDFWRKKGRLGREMVDEANEVFKHKLSDSDGKEVEIYNVTDLVYKTGNDLEKLIDALMPIEILLFKSIEKEKKLKDKNEKLEVELKTLKLQKQELERKLVDVQEIIFKIFRYSTNEKVPLQNMLDTGEKETDIVKEALESMFDKPAFLYEWFDRNAKKEQTSNIFNLEENKVNNSKSIMKRFSKI